MAGVITNLFKLLQSPFLLFVLGLPAVIWVAAACFIGGMTVPEALESVAFRTFFSLFSLFLILHAVASLSLRAVTAFLVYGGIIMLLAQVAVWYGFHFTGEAGCGTGDQIVDYHREQRGVWSGDVRIPARVAAISGVGGDGIEFLINGKTEKIPLKGSFVWNGFRVSPLSVERAPLMSMEDEAGRNVETLYIKMGTVAPERDFFLVKTMPHRIYIAPDGVKGLKLHIVRDKLEIATRSLLWGEALSYGGNTLRFDSGELWVRISVEKILTPWFAFAGTGMLVAALISYLRKKRCIQ